MTTNMHILSVCFISMWFLSLNPSSLGLSFGIYMGAYYAYRDA
jgi:hypothetical protein